MKHEKLKLNSTEPRQAKPKDKLYYLPDGQGLRLWIAPTGTKSWRYHYKIGKRDRVLTIGNFPDISLADARRLRDEAKSKLSNNIDPALEKQIFKNIIREDTFQAIAESWLDENKEGWSDSHHTRITNYMVNDVYPIIGRIDIKEIEAPVIIMIIKAISSRGANNSAKRVKGFIQQVFDYAVAYGKATRNPAKDINLSLILPKTIKRHFAAITDPVKLGELLRAIDAYSGSIQVKSALQLAPMLMMRPSELSNGEWREIDLDNAVWLLPAERRKLQTHLKKANREEDAHIIPLPKQAIAVLENLFQYTGHSQYLFTGQRGASRPISNNALRVALRTLGYSNDEITPHGFRGVASTFLNTLGYRSEVIEAQLAHKDKNAIRAAYNHADYLQERTAMMQEWTNYLDSLKQNNNVIPLNRIKNR